MVASFPTPFQTAPHYRDLPGLELLTPPDEFPTEPAVMVTFDCGSLSRLGDLEPAAKGAHELIVIDHHVSNDRYGTINLVEPSAAASGVVVQRLVDAMGLPLSRDAAVCLYAALVCDTGRFQYETTTTEVFEFAAPAHRVRRAGARRCRARSSRSTGSRTCSCSARPSATRSSSASSASCGPRSPRTCSSATT